MATVTNEREARPAAAEAAEALVPEVELPNSADPVAFGRTLARVGAGVASHPLEAGLAGLRYLSDLAAAGSVTFARALGADCEGPFSPAPRDSRFDDLAWQSNPAYYGLLQGYLAWARFADDLVAVAGLDERETRKAEFAMQMVVDALAPSNFLLGNPAALKKAFDTGGASLVRGMRNFLDDVRSNDGFPRQVDLAPFKVGDNLAATPGKVVFRNDLMELIQYEPQTETVFETPLLLSPPWINKYYIMDLAPGRSFAEWAVTHGHTVFAISYRNPDSAQRDVALDDYLLQGPRIALDVIGDITGAPKANVVGLCLGGTLTAMLLAYLADQGDDRVRSATLLNTLVDFGEPGQLGVFTDPETIAGLEQRMAERGYLDGAEMARTFDLLRANNLIWNYVASNWLMGEDPPAFDILAWNSDSTRLPAAMHSFYLRSCYVENALARGELELAGTRLRLEDVTADTYVLAAKEDHIAPWGSSYRTTQLLRGSEVRFVLSSSGHIAGIVNPPNPKSRHWTLDEHPPDADDWVASASEHEGSWWEDWAAWIELRAGERRSPPPLGSQSYPALAEAPGSYVHAR
ncbi:MAG: alpha/beta fold hydrolase [Actinomycetota bacterium]|nr:alpha/beta fold hydrolase [Actinomycetota bacterium]